VEKFGRIKKKAGKVRRRGRSSFGEGCVWKKEQQKKKKKEKEGRQGEGEGGFLKDPEAKTTRFSRGIATIQKRLFSQKNITWGRGGGLVKKNGREWGKRPGLFHRTHSSNNGHETT